MTLIMILLAPLITALLYLTATTLFLAHRNRKAHQFFKTKTPWLPVVPNRSLLTGNAIEMLGNDKFFLKWTEGHKKYGETYGFYFGPQPLIVTLDLDLLRKVMVDEGYKHIDRMSFQSPLKVLSLSLIQVHGDDWRKLRKVTAPALTSHRIKSDGIESQIHSILQRLKGSIDRRITTEGAGKAVEINLGEVCKRVVLSVMSLMIFKQQEMIDFEADEDPFTESLEAMNLESVTPLYIAALINPALAPLACLSMRLSAAGNYMRRTTKDVERFIKMKSEILKSKSANRLQEITNKPRYLIDYLIDAYFQRKINHDILEANAIAFIPAGTDSTSGAAINLFWNLVQNEQIQDKLRKAIIEEGVEAEYLNWCVLEAVRWCPPVPLAGGRVLASDVTHKGKLYPKGSTIVSCEWSKHRNPEIWPEPEKFIPERFKELSKMHPAAFSAFGMGPRNCVGGKLAVLELKMLAQFFLTNYKLEKCPRTPTKFSISAPGLLWFNLDEKIFIKLTPYKR